MKALIIGAAAIMLAAGPATPASSAPKTLCVKVGGGSGCKATIGDALAVANAGDTILVAQGTYPETLTITESVKLLGGWNNKFTKRNPTTRVTTIQGPSAPPNSVVTITGVFGTPSAVAPRVDGFTITGGDPGNHGGGLRIQDSNAIINNDIITSNIGYLLGGGVWVQRGAPMISNSTISNNQVTSPGSAGGGIELENTQATLKNNTITGNQGDAAVGYGGGIAIQSGSVKLINNTVSTNLAATLPGGATDFSYGGGISVQNAEVTISGGTIASNTASSAATNARGNGGGVYISGSVFTITNATIDQNTAGYWLSGVSYLYGGGVLIDSGSTGTIENSTISNNRANRATIFGNGGGIAVVGSTLDLAGGAVTGNSTALNYEGYGGGLYGKDSDVSVDAAVFDNNKAGNTPTYGKGGGMAFVNTPFVVTNTIVSNNYAFNNDTAVGGVNADATSTGVIVNCTFAKNKGQAIRTATGLTVRNTIVTDATTGIDATAGVAALRNDDFFNNTFNTKNATVGPSNLLVDPMVDASTFHLLPGSPMIDAGTKVLAPDHDIDGQPRPMVGTSGLPRVDIGADERAGP